MDYDYNSSRQRAGASPYDPHIPMYQKLSSSSSSQPSYSSSSLYPKLGQSGQPVIPPPARAPPYHPSSAPPPSSGTGTGTGTGIRVQIKPQYRITPPPQMLPPIGDIPRSTFQFDFDLEKKILAEAEKENQNWSRLASENLPSRPPQSMPSTTPAVDPVVNKYIASGLNREAVPLAVAAFGDNPTKITEFVNGFTVLREMGFASNNVADVLLMHDNDTEKALAHFLGSSS
ncbi:Stathmin-3 [Bienertia sinuspersici]